DIDLLGPSRHHGGQHSDQAGASGGRRGNGYARALRIHPAPLWKQSVTVAVVDVGIVRMRVNKVVVVMRVLMRFFAVPGERMLVPVMKVVDMRMVVILGFM